MEDLEALRSIKASGDAGKSSEEIVIESKNDESNESSKDALNERAKSIFGNRNKPGKKAWVNI